TTVAAHITQNLVTGVIQDSAGLLRADASNLSAGEIAQRYFGTAAGGVGRGVTSGIGDFGGQQVRLAAERRNRPQARQEEEELEDAAHDPRRLPGDQEVRRLTGEPEGPQTLTVAAVNETHAVSVRR